MHGIKFSSLSKGGIFSIYLFAAVASIVISFLTLSKGTVINPDGICYMQSAATMNMGLTVASHLCGQAQWPFYSMLIYGVAKMTHLSYDVAVILLNSCLSLLSVLMFVAITATLTSSKRVIALAAVVILLAHEFNSLRADVIRDHGFWAFYLLSIWMFLHYFRSKTAVLAWLWSASLIIATLFRIEGAVFLLVLPWVAWFEPSERGERIKAFLQLNTITILGVASLAIWLLLHPHHSLGRLSEVQLQLTHGLQMLIENFNLKAESLGQHVLSVFSARDATLVLLLMLVSWYVVSIGYNLSWIYALLVLYAWCNKLARLDFAGRCALWGYVVVNVLITSVFLVDHFFLSKRYLMALSLVLMLWVPFALDYLIAQWRVRKWPLILVCFFILFYALGGIFDFGFSKNYIRQAGDWLSVHAAPDAKIYSNDYQVLYYSKHFGNAIFAKGVEFNDLAVVANGRWRQYDFIALRISNKEAAKNASILKELTGMTPVQVYKNQRDDEVRIYRVYTHYTSRCELEALILRRPCDEEFSKNARNTTSIPPLF